MNLRWVAFGSVVISVLAVGAALGSQADAAAGPPTVTGVSPAVGLTKGGNSVSITGSGLSAVMRVSFGSATSTKITPISTTIIHVKAPRHVRGRVHVRVTTKTGRSAGTARDLYYFVTGAPRVTWSERALVHGTETQGQKLRAVSCASSTHCVLINTYRHAFTWNGHVISESTFDTDRRNNYNLISCPTTTFCMVAGTNSTFNGPMTTSAVALVGAKHSAAVHIGADDRKLVSLSCSSPHLCVAVQESGNYSVYRDGHWSASARFPDDFYADGNSAVDCPTDTVCVASGDLDDHPAEATFNGRRWGALRRMGDGIGGVIISGQYLSCTQPTYCAAAVPGAAPLVRRYGVWAHITAPDGQRPSSIGLSCGSVTFCVQVSPTAKRAVAFNGAASTITPSPVSAIGISCPTDRFCMSAGLKYISIGRRAA